MGFLQRARPQARCDGGRSTTEDWFAFGTFGDDASAYDALAAHCAICCRK